MDESMSDNYQHHSKLEYGILLMSVIKCEREKVEKIERQILCALPSPIHPLKNLSTLQRLIIIESIYYGTLVGEPKLIRHS